MLRENDRYARWFRLWLAVAVAALLPVLGGWPGGWSGGPSGSHPVVGPLSLESKVVTSTPKSRKGLEAAARKSGSLQELRALGVPAAEERLTVFAKLRPGAAEPGADRLVALGLVIVDRFPQAATLVLELAEGAEPERSIVEAVASLPEIAWAEVGEPRQATMRPNDPRYGEQWGMPATGFQAAWDVTVGDNQVVVAILDSGIAQDIPDLAGRVVDPFSTLHETSDDWAWEDVFGHGSAVAGVAVAQGDNRWGIAGAAWNVRLMPVHFTDDGTVQPKDYVEAIYYAVDHGADVINISYGSDSSFQAERDAIAYALSHRVVVVASAGNGGRSSHVQYPAALPGVIAVGATDSDNELAYFSSVGPEVDLVAPGKNILTFYATSQSSGLAMQAGTSFSAPLVTGAVALLLSRYPELTAGEVEAYLERGARDLGDAGFDSQYGNGLLDIEQALRQADASTTTTTQPIKESPFSDVDQTDPYFDAVVGMAEAGIVNGRSDGTFGTRDPVVRAQFAKMACGALAIPVEEDMVSTFRDLGPDDQTTLYPNEFIAAAESEGVMKGVVAGYFQPWNGITRAQLVTAVVRGIQAVYPGFLAQPPASFVGSLGSFSPDHAPAMRLAEYNALMEGLVGFGPDWDPWTAASRGEVAQILWRVMQLR